MGEKQEDKEKGEELRLILAKKQTVTDDCLYRKVLICREKSSRAPPEDMERRYKH